MQSEHFHIVGTVGLVCHNAQLSDPLNPWTQAVAEITAKRKKTNADLQEMAKREFFGSLYISPKTGHPTIPGGNIERMLRDAAAKNSKGKDVQAGLIVLDDEPIEIELEGTRDPEKIWAAGKQVLRASAKVGKSRVMRTRPCFLPWALTFEVLYDERILNGKAVRSYVELAGRMVGLGDWRPKYGRFNVEE